VIGMALLGLCGIAAAQRVDDPPPPIVFPDWKLIGQEGPAIRYEVEFPSAIASGIEANDRMIVHCYLPPLRQNPVPAVLILHYWGATDHRVEANMARELARRGVAGVVISLPYHIERTPEGFRSGELAITPEPKKLIATMTQSIADIRRTIDFIQSRPEFRKDQIGLTGTSLGSIVGALASGIDARISDVAFVVGGADLAHILWNSSRVVKERDQLRRMGYTESKLSSELEVIEPSVYLAKRKPANAFVVGARFDTVIPPADTVKLIEALDAKHTLWLDTGHYGGFFIQKKVQQTVAQFFQSSFRGEAFTAPDSLNAPTVRLGVSILPNEDFQLAVGLDLFRPAKNGDLLGTALVTPGGFQLFLGTQIDRGFSLGAVATSKKVTIGVFWSIVL
jgi:hypothetical protein